MSRDEIIAVTVRLTEAINTGKLDELDEICAEDMVDHAATTRSQDSETGHMAYKRYIEALRDAFPDLTLTPDHIDATDDDITIIYTVCGTHCGRFLGVAPTGLRVSTKAMQIARFRDGKIVERWGTAIELGLMKHLNDELDSSTYGHSDEFDDRVDRVL